MKMRMFNSWKWKSNHTLIGLELERGLWNEKVVGFSLSLFGFTLIFGIGNDEEKVEE